MSVGQTSAASVFSFSSSRDGSAMLREAEGRIFNSQNELYYLPADELEYSRLDKQHFVHLLANDGLVARAANDKVRAILDVNNVTADGSPRRVLDLGCGGGNWAISMALEYPHVEVVGVDLAPNTTRPPPPNCRFEFDDFNLGMSHYHEMFDVVHARSCANGVIDFREFVNDMGLCLRPGGIILVVEGDLQLYSYLREPQELAYGDGNPDKSWMARMLFEAFTTMKGRGSHVDANIKIHGWLCENPLFQDEDWAKIFSPIGPWERGRTEAESRKLETIGELMRQNSLSFVRALKPLLLSEGYFPETVDRFIAGTDRELAELNVHMYVQWHYAWAIRKPEGDSALVPPDERVAESTQGAGFVSDPSSGSTIGSPFTAATLSPPAQNLAGPSIVNNSMFMSPPFMGQASQHDKMVDVGLWAAESTEASGEVGSNSGSEHDSDEDFVDADSDGDTDIESVTDL
ncbi:hypothetical protein FRC09_005486 [Ceratobasidium sp. 395]|nr:hypothetical protein FRC09_005486 [Ceratobasidium sp. 395]